MIRPPAINLARRPFRNNSVYYGVFVTCGVLLMVASGYNVYDFVQTGRQMSVLQQDLDARQHAYLELRDEVEKMKKEVSHLDLGTLNQKSSFANGLILSRQFSWSVLFDRIEDLMPPHVKIRSIRPSISAKGGIEIQLDGMAQGADDLYEFELGLVTSQYFTGVYPLSENSKESRAEINFDLAMKYVPAGRTPAGTVAANLPSTPTEGLPNSEAAPAAGQTADANAATAAAAAGDGASVTPGSTAAPSQGAEQAAQTPQPEPAAVEESQPPPQAPPRQLSKAPPLMTNKEFIEELGEERFSKVRGKLKPPPGGREPDMTNEEFIKKYGKEEFLKERGGLTRAQMYPLPVVGAGAQPAPGAKP